MAVAEHRPLQGDLDSTRRSLGHAAFEPPQIAPCGATPLRDGVWAILACVPLPDLVVWRFSVQPAEHFHGGVRQTFQRLWMRGRILDRRTNAAQRCELLGKLTEDALVQITERSSIGNDARLSWALAEGQLRASPRRGQTAMEDAMRKTLIRLRLRIQIQVLPELDDPELSKAVDEFFEQSAADDGDDNPGRIAF